jgi:hypothetical protein
MPLTEDDHRLWFYGRKTRFRAIMKQAQRKWPKLSGDNIMLWQSCHFDPYEIGIKPCPTPTSIGDDYQLTLEPVITLSQVEKAISDNFHIQPDDYEKIALRWENQRLQIQFLP